MKVKLFCATIAMSVAVAVPSISTADHHGTPDSAESDSKTVTTASGLIITELAKGDERRPTKTDTVRVHYHGTFENGKVFDSSVERDQPATFGLNRVIKCWTEGLQRMGIGGKSRLVCPPSIAYGPRGRPPKIPPSATLIFEVELLDIKKDSKKN